MTEGADRLGGVVEDEPFLFAVRILARLHQIHGLDEGILPLVGGGPEGWHVQPIDEGFIEKSFQIGTAN